MTTSNLCEIFSIGHSTHSLEDFLGLLELHGISAVADVRSSPYSRYCPQFNMDALSDSLKELEIKYVFLGRELGARAEDPSCYINGRVQYSLLAKQKSFLEGIERVKKGSRELKIALMCAEREPLDCHRTLLVANALEGEGCIVNHIHSDGHLERHGDAMERLLEVTGLPQEDLFRSKEELMAEAFSKQEERIAYKVKDVDAKKTGEVQ
jgi:uncharacterized protein (DUF488 family)